VRQQKRQSRRRRKGKVGRAIDVCLEQFGFTTAAPTTRISEPVREPAAAPPPRAQRNATPDKSALLNATGYRGGVPGPEHKYRSIHVESAQLALPPLTGNEERATAI
jgi:HlyD family secretion protein